MFSNFIGEEGAAETIYKVLCSLGYVLLFLLTGSHERVPASFHEMLNEVGIISTVEPRDLFAECFAVALCTLPELHRYDPYPNISSTLKADIFMYMQHLASNQSKIKYKIDCSKARFQS